MLCFNRHVSFNLTRPITKVMSTHSEGFQPRVLCNTHGMRKVAPWVTLGFNARV